MKTLSSTFFFFAFLFASNNAFCQIAFQTYPIGTTVDLAINQSGSIYCAHAIFNSAHNYVGMTKVAPNGDTTRLTPPNTSWCSSCVARIDIDQYGNLYYVSYGDGHVGKYDAQDQHTYLLKMPGSYGAGYANKMVVESDTSLIVSMRPTVCRMNILTNTAYRFLNNGYDNLSAIPASDGTLWQMRPDYFGQTTNRNLLHHFDHHGAIIAHFDTSHAATCSIYGRPVYKTFPMVEDRIGNIWYSTCDSGLLRLEPNTGTITPFWLHPDSALQQVNDVIFDAQNNAWVATSEGLMKLNTTNGQYQMFTTTDGLLDNKILSLAFQGNDTLWVGSEDGVTRMILVSLTNTIDIKQDDWQIIPNPVHSTFSLKLTENVEANIENITISDALGRACVSRANGNFLQEFDFSAFPNGVYSVVLTLKNGEKSVRLMMK
jgi:streptogramin lyase